MSDGREIDDRYSWQSCSSDESWHQSMVNSVTVGILDLTTKVLADLLDLAAKVLVGLLDLPAIQKQ